LHGVSRKIPPEQRQLALSWTHHLMSLRVSEEKQRAKLLQRAVDEKLGTTEFSKLITKVK